MADVEINDNGHIFFVNNYFGSFYKSVLNWAGNELYPRVNYKVLATYDKAVEYFNKKKENNGEVNVPILPAVTLDPSYDFEPATPEGKFLWAYNHLAPGMAAKLFNSIEGISRDQDIILTPIFTKYSGSFQLTFWIHSIYELLDLRVRILQACGGYNRILRPNLIDSFIVLPDEVVDRNTGHGIPIDWSKTNLETKLIDNIGKTKSCIPLVLTPTFKLTGINDSSTKFGGDSIAEYKLSASFEYEINIPTFIHIKDWPYADKLRYTINIDSAFGTAGTGMIYNPSTNSYVNDLMYCKDVPLYMISNNEAESNLTYSRDFKLVERIIYNFTGNEIVSQDGTIDIPYSFNSKDESDRYIVASYNGKIDKGDWLIDEVTNTFKIKILLREDESVEFYRFVTGQS